MPLHRTLALSALAVVCLVAPARAQDEDPHAVLRASTEAIAKLPGFSAQFRLTGDGSELLKSTMPALSGRLVFGRTDTGPVLHGLGESRDPSTAPAAPFDVARTRDTISWTDDAKRTVFVRRANPEPRDMPGPARLLHLSNLLQHDPYAASLGRAESVAHEAVREAAGEACDVILISFPKAAPGRSGPGFTAERWFIARSDKLPRRYEQITDAGLVKYSLVTEISNVSIGEQTEADLSVRRPADYKVDDQTAPAVAEQVAPAAEAPAQPAGPRRVSREATPAPAREPAAPGPAGPRVAPDFSFTPDGGSAVTNSTQRGRVTVLYFWGTWCIPCRAVSPKISELAQAFADRPVDVFAPAVRERSVDAPRSYLADNGYAHRLVPDAEELAKLFRVRVYPTVVVIAPDGTIAFEGHPGSDRTPEALGEEVRAAVERVLPGA